MDYQGYKLIDKIILVCRDVAEHKENSARKEYQAYLVDPSNKKQLESARSWAKWTEYGPSYLDETGKRTRDYEIEHKPVEFEFDNNGFTLELRDCAGGSSQGGRLSFWNCVATKDDVSFIIGIDSDMLLELLKNATFINGKCQSPLIFITKTGRVGMTVEDSETWHQCIRDMELKNTMKRTQTSKFSFGDRISTATIDEYYLGTITKYYKFDSGRNDDFHYRSKGINFSDCTITKLKKPITYHLFTDSYNVISLKEVLTKQESSIYSYFSIKKTCPKRSITGKINMDCTEKEYKQELFRKIYDYEAFLELLNATSVYKGCDEAKSFFYFLSKSTFGYGFEPFELSNEILSKIKVFGIKYIDETSDR